VNVRPITPDDFPALAAFLAEDETRLFGRESRLGVPDVTAWLAHVDLERDTWLFQEDGQVVALGWVEVEAHHEAGLAIGVVHRDRHGRGLGSRLLDLTEERLGELEVARTHHVTLAPETAASTGDSSSE
jgi:GNAT superfamily N-acetyltransferase